MAVRDADPDDDGHDDGVEPLWRSRTPVPGTWVRVDEEVFLDGIDDGLPKGWELGWRSDGQAEGHRRIGWFESRDCLLAALQGLEVAADVAGASDDLLPGNGFARVQGGSSDAPAWERALSSGRTARVVAPGGFEVDVRRGDGDARLVAAVSPAALAGPWPGRSDEWSRRLALQVALTAFECTLDPCYMGP